MKCNIFTIKSSIKTPTIVKNVKDTPMVMEKKSQNLEWKLSYTNVKI